MSIASIYTLADAQKVTGANRNLITYLIQDRQIPVKLVGIAKVLDEDGLSRLKEAIDDYNAKSERRAPVTPASPARPRRHAAQAGA
jgi:hypothetical protein